MCDAILALNAGFSSIKFGVYDVGKANRPVVAARGTLEMGASPPRCDINLKIALYKPRQWDMNQHISALLSIFVVTPPKTRSASELRPKTPVTMSSACSRRACSSRLEQASPVVLGICKYCAFAP